jgi:hypothetical protein
LVIDRSGYMNEFFIINFNIQGKVVSVWDLIECKRIGRVGGSDASGDKVEVLPLLHVWEDIVSQPISHQLISTYSTGRQAWWDCSIIEKIVSKVPL